VQATGYGAGRLSGAASDPDTAPGALLDLWVPPREVLRKRLSLQLPPHLPVDAWQRIGEQIGAISDCSAWWLGDWLVYGQDVHPDRYRRAVAETSLDYQTLRNYAWVARRFSSARRRDNLSFQHHAEVAALPEAEQDHWLDFAARLKWSRNKLREQVRWSRDDADAAETIRSIQVSVALIQQRRWQQAAENDNDSLAKWIVRVVDEAAERSLRVGALE
jgi:hypothetical protein